MARVTALRVPKPGRVAVELDGVCWRTLPLEVVVRAGLNVGEELDRPRLRLLRRELRRHEAIAAAAAVLRHRDHSVQSLEQKLEQRGIAPTDRGVVVETLERAGLVDDVRFASGRARTLAERGWSDAAIRADLERQGLDGEPVTEALAALEPEHDRAVLLAARRGGGLRAARWLASRGFDADGLEGLVAEDGGAAVR
jgi:SOS response regulatory protein OraA/RecX